MTVHGRSTQVLERGFGSRPEPPVECRHAPRIPLSGRRVRLRPVVASDYDFLFFLAADERTAPHWRYRGLPPRFEEFVHDLWQGVLVQFVVEHVDTNERLGLVVAYQGNLRDGHCHIGVLFRADIRVVPVEGLLLFVNFLFQEFGFEKLYAHVIEYNLGALGSVLGRWMEREGVLVGHEFHAGQRWDVHILSVWRDRFEQNAGRLIEMATRELPA
jgi:RimJ/RimL family protein N-acetyltransferase